MINLRSRGRAWRLRINLWLARQRARWQSFSDGWRVPPVITSRWFTLGIYFLVVLLVSLAWFGRPALDWQGAKAPDNDQVYDIDFFYDPSADLAPSLYDPDRSLTVPGDWTGAPPGDSEHPAVPVNTPESDSGGESTVSAGVQTPPAAPQENQPAPPPGLQSPTEAWSGGGALPFDRLHYPVDGDVAITNPYALISRSSTFNDWRAHLAVDLAAAVGTPVYAAAAGTVKQILQNDILWGTVVILDHGNGCTTSYSSLQDLSVRMGQSVAVGEVLGRLAGSPPAEQLELSHLHFALFEGEQAVDPTELLR